MLVLLQQAQSLQSQMQNYLEQLLQIQKVVQGKKLNLKGPIILEVYMEDYERKRTSVAALTEPGSSGLYSQRSANNSTNTTTSGLSSTPVPGGK
jgi:hypothetical protein